MSLQSARQCASRLSTASPPAPLSREASDAVGNRDRRVAHAALSGGSSNEARDGQEFAKAQTSMSQRLQRLDVKLKAEIEITFLPPAREAPRTTLRPSTDWPATPIMPAHDPVGGDCAIRFLDWGCYGVFQDKHMQVRRDSRVGFNSMPKLLRPPMDQIDLQISRADAHTRFGLDCRSRTLLRYRQ